MGDEDPWIQTDRLRAIPGVRTSESNNSVLGKFQATLSKCRKTTTHEDTKDAYMPSGSQEPRLKADGCKLRVRRKICRLTGK